MVLTGDATKTTREQMDAMCTDEKKFPCDLINDIGYYLAPHHGSKLQDSHKLISNFKPHNAVIFSSTMYSQHKHPTCEAVLLAVQEISVDLSVRAEKHLIFCDNTDGYTAEEIDHILQQKNTSRAFSYTIGNMPGFDTSKVLTALDKPIEEFMNNLLGKPKYILATTQLPIWTTAVSGEIECTYKACEPVPMGVPRNLQSSSGTALPINDDNLRHFARLSPDIGEYMTTKFTAKEIVDSLLSARQRARARISVEPKGRSSKKQTSQPKAPTRSSLRVKEVEFADEAGKLIDLKEAMGILSLNEHRIII